MPAPHVLVVQLHSLTCTSFGPVGTWHIGMVGSADCGNGVVAPSRSRARNCAALRLPLAPAISATMPETIGAAKLVPTFTLV